MVYRIFCVSRFLVLFICVKSPAQDRRARFESVSHSVAEILLRVARQTPAKDGHFKTQIESEPPTSSAAHARKSTRTSFIMKHGRLREGSKMGKSPNG